MSSVKSPAPAAKSSKPRERRTWPIKICSLEDPPGRNLADSTTAEERLTMMWEMTVSAWMLSGRTLPDYPRDKAPVRVIPLSQK